jgi:flagellar protein FlbD
LILVTRFDGSTFYINAEMIRSIEHTPDTVITLTTDYKIVVRDSAEEILERFIDYQRSIHSDKLSEYLLSKLKED